MTSLPLRVRAALPLVLALPVIAGACATASERSATAGAQATSQPSQAGQASSQDGPTARPQTAAGSWLDIELADAGTGEAFTLASLAGQVVAIEPMAIWCPSCKAQQDTVREVYADIEAAGIRYISLGVDPSEDARSLARYAQKHGYEWTFVEAPNRFARALADLFGPQILSPPSTPLIVLDASGEVVVQDFGRLGPGELIDTLEEAA